jgi:hypothetical protein
MLTAGFGGHLVLKLGIQILKIYGFGHKELSAFSGQLSAAEQGSFFCASLNSGATLVYYLISNSSPYSTRGLKIPQVTDFAGA